VPTSTRHPPKPPLRPEFAALRRELDETTLHDRRALSRALDVLNAKSDDEKSLAVFRAKLQSAREKFSARAALVPEIRVDESLPIATMADDIVGMIRTHQVVVLAGETGSGKSTQLPKLCLAAGRGVAGFIGCTQPRRVAARSVARRVAAELGTELGGVVGYQVRFTETTSVRTLIKFMTDGILLAETQSDPWLNRYDTIILDEAHERSLNIDFLLGYLKRLLARRKDLKLIVTSATIDTATFARHFDNAPVINVEGRSYPVEVRWRPPQDRDDSTTTERIIAAVDEITHEDGRGDVLIFLPGEREIRDAHLALSRRKYRSTEVLPLYARHCAREALYAAQPARTAAHRADLASGRGPAQRSLRPRQFRHLYTFIQRGRFPVATALFRAGNPALVAGRRDPAHAQPETRRCGALSFCRSAGHPRDR
jgi:ATP-dependent helicase HrpA